MHRPGEYNAKAMYNKVQSQFQRLLKMIGLEERKEGMQSQYLLVIVL